MENNHIQRFKQFDETLINNLSFEIIPKKLIDSKQEVYYTDKDQKLIKNDVVLRKINQTWEICVKIDDVYGYHRVICESYQEADQILSALIHLRMHQTEPMFEIQCTNFLGKQIDGSLVKLKVCRVVVPTDYQGTDIIFKESSFNNQSNSTSKYQFLKQHLSFYIQRFNQQPKIVKAPSMNLLKRYASKELITHEGESLKKLIKFKSTLNSGKENNSS